MSILAGMMNQIITSVYSVTTSGSGDTTRTLVYSNVPCRWIKRSKQFFRSDSEPIVTTIQAWIHEDYTILSSYEIEYDSLVYRVIDVEERLDLGGTKDHTKVYLA